MTLTELSQIRTLVRWLRRTGKPIDMYPKIRQLSAMQIDDARKFANGTYPIPSRWTIRLYEIAKG
jgi:hypothetical protein